MHKIKNQTKGPSNFTATASKIKVLTKSIIFVTNSLAASSGVLTFVVFGFDFVMAAMTHKEIKKRYIICVYTDFYTLNATHFLNGIYVDFQNKIAKTLTVDLKLMTFFHFTS